MKATSLGLFAAGMGLPPRVLKGRMLRYLERPEDERDALLAVPAPRCARCDDGGQVWMRFDDPAFEHGRIAGVTRLGMGQTNHREQPEFVLVWCDQCAPAEQRRRQLLGMHVLDVEECRFETYDPYDSADLANMRAIAQRWASREERRPILLLVGNAGIGKSHLAKAAALQLAEHGYSVQFHTGEHILERIRSTFGKQEDASRPTTEEAVAAFAGAGVLVIDDLGAEYATEWAAKTLEGVIFQRYEQRALTVITANKDLEEIAKHQRDPHLRLFDRLGDVRRTVYVEAHAESWRANGGRPKRMVAR